MEILGVCLTIISLIGAYLWRANGKLQKRMMECQERISECLVKISECLVRIEEGQKEIVQGQKEIAQMLLNQTKILEKIERKIPSST